MELKSGLYDRMKEENWKPSKCGLENNEKKSGGQKIYKWRNAENSMQESNPISDNKK